MSTKLQRIALLFLGLNSAISSVRAWPLAKEPEAVDSGFVEPIE